MVLAIFSLALMVHFIFGLALMYLAMCILAVNVLVNFGLALMAHIIFGLTLMYLVM